jgi:uncharacterized protein
MHCYVLHPENKAAVCVEHDSTELRYRWMKGFHVSPFLPLAHEYDWTFQVPGKELSMSSLQRRVSRERFLEVSDPALARTAVEDDEDDGSGCSVGQVVFTTSMKLERREMSVLGLFWRLLLLPWLTVLIQFWIHWEGIRIVLKGSPLYPHPHGTETWLTRLIHWVATPLLWFVEPSKPKQS